MVSEGNRQDKGVGVSSFDRVNGEQEFVTNYPG
jgi:hypothetical protein